MSTLLPSHPRYKLTIIQENTKFFLEVMHNQKSNKLEWIIIVLLSAEIVVMSMDLFDVSTSFDFLNPPHFCRAQCKKAPLQRSMLFISTASLFSEHCFMRCLLQVRPQDAMDFCTTLMP